MMSEIVSRKRFLSTTVRAGSAAAAWELGFLPTSSAAEDAYDAIIIGTGFGGAVAAQTLVANGKKVLMLERGVWYVSPDRVSVHTGEPQVDYLHEKNLPVEYWPRPDRSSGLVDVAKKMRRIGSLPLNPRGLYQYSPFKDASILTASGVGGGSLIYSNVNLRPDKTIRDRLKLTDDDYKAAEAWMTKNRGRFNKVVTKSPVSQKTDFRALASDVDVRDPNDPSKVVTVGKNYLLLDRSRVLFEAAGRVTKGMGVANGWEPLDLSINEYDPTSDTATEADKQKAYCERQGRCVLGCLPQARHTLNKLYYGIWKSGQAERLTIWPLTEVQTFRREGNRWKVTFRDHAKGGTETSITAPLLFLAAGSLGTSEILLRTKAKNLVPLPSMIGHNFSTNGDFGAFVRKTSDPVYSTRGPINTCHVPFKTEDGRNITVEDCAIPSMFASIVAATIRVHSAPFAAKAEFLVKWALAWTKRPNIFGFSQPTGIPPDTDDAKNEAELVSNTFFFNVMGEDDANGTFKLENDRLNLSWPAANPIQKHSIFKAIENILQKFATEMGGTYIPLPLWDGWGQHKLIVTHPIGGCPMGDDSTSGAVNRSGQIFDGTPGAGPTAVLPGLYVVDGSVLPVAVASNPTLTIVAQAVKTMAPWR